LASLNRFTDRFDRAASEALKLLRQALNAVALE
jgi:hypothetical protein